MATPNVVPRANTEGGLGTIAKSWGKLRIQSSASLAGPAGYIKQFDVDQDGLQVDGGAITSGNCIYVPMTSVTSGKGLYVQATSSLATDGRLMKTRHWDQSPGSVVTVSNELQYYTTVGVSGGNSATKTNLRLETTNINAGNSGTINHTAIYNEMYVINNGGANDNSNITQIGLHNKMSLGTTANNIGVYSELPDGGIDVKFVSSADSGDYFSIATTAAGATTITTVDDDAAAAHLTFDIDGNFLMDSSTGTTFWYLNGNTADYASFVIGADGDFTFTTVDAAAAAANLTFNIDGDFIINSTDFSVNGTGTITDGEWGGGIIGVEYGGTGAGSFTDNAVLTGTGTSAITAEADLSFTSETLTIGADDDGIATIERKTHGDDDGGNLVIQAGDATGTDKDGGNLILKAGAGTGAGDTTANGIIEFMTAIPTGTGTSQQNTGYATAKLQSISNANQFIIYEPGTVQTDYFRINVGVAGATTLSTADSAATAAHFEVAADGNITLDAAGTITFEQGTNSASLMPADGKVVVQQNFMRISPTDFFPNGDSGRPAFVADQQTNKLGVHQYNTDDELYAFVIIPHGATVTNVTVNTSSTVSSGVSIGAYNFDTGADNGVTATTGDTNADISLGANTISSNEQGVWVKVSMANAAIYLWGAKLTLTF